MKKILVTNDDGIFAPGLTNLVKELQTLGEVFVVAPDRERSATGHAITVHQPLRAVDASVEGASQAFAVSGTPADCVKLAVERLFPNEIDLVVSGINRGANMGTDVLYSGTVSAALEGVILGLPSLALSLAEFNSPRFAEAAKHATWLVQKLAEQPWPDDTLINANFPGSGFARPKGIKVTSLGRRRYENAFVQRHDPWGREYFWLGGDIDDSENAEHTDVWAVNQGFISLTPIHFDLTDYKLLKTIESWNLALPGEEEHENE